MKHSLKGRLFKAQRASGKTKFHCTLFTQTRKCVDFEMENVTTVSQQNFYVNRFIFYFINYFRPYKKLLTTVYFDI